MMQDKRESGVIPNGVTFGTEVLVMPSLIGSVFTHAGGIDTVSYKPNRYSWVKKGDVIAEVYISRPKTKFGLINDIFFNDIISKVPIKSPASGLALHSEYSDNFTVKLKDDVPPIANFSLLLPSDEVREVSGASLFRAAVNLIKENSDLLYKESRRWTMKGKTPQELESLLAQQLAANCRRYPATPYFDDYLDEARTEFPELRQHLKHLVNKAESKV